MDVCMDDAGCVAPSQSTTNVLAVGQASYQRAQEPEALGMDITPTSASEVMRDGETKSLEIPNRTDTRCPSASSSQPDRRGGVSYVLQPDGNCRPIELGAGTTVVGRSTEYGIQDCHVSRRHVEVTVPEKGADGSDAGWCLIKNIGRNCRTVVVNGIFLKAEQEVIAGRGTKIILNANDKGRPQYTYTLVPTANFQPLVTRKPTRSRGGAFRRPKLRRPLWDSMFVLERKRAQAHARFRKEKQEKLQREREEILKTFADLHVA